MLDLGAEMTFIACLLPRLEVMYCVSDMYTNKVHLMHFFQNMVILPTCSVTITNITWTIQWTIQSYTNINKKAEIA